jgi:uncharacterized protein YdeI (BOF family)
MEELEKYKAQNKAYEQFFINLTNSILAEIDKDGWCRLTVSKEDAIKMREDVEKIKRGELS